MSIRITLREFQALESRIAVLQARVTELEKALKKAKE